MPTTNINQRVKRIADLTDADVTKLQGIGVNTEEDLRFVKFDDLGDEIGVIKRRKLEYIIKFLVLRNEPLTGTTTMEQIQGKVENPPTSSTETRSGSSTENRGGPKVNTNPLPKFNGNPVDYESWELQAGATIRQTLYKHYLTRPADQNNASEKERSSELFNMLLSSVSDGSALNIVEKVKDENHNEECGHKAWKALSEWYTDASQTKTIVKHYSNKLRNLVLDRDTTASKYINDFEIFVRKLEKYEGAWSEDKRIREFISNVRDDDYDTEMRVHDNSYTDLINAFRKRERDLGTIDEGDRRERRFKAYPSSDLQNEGSKREKGRGEGKGDGEKIPMMPKFLFSSFTETQRRNVAKWRALCNSGKEMKLSDLRKSKDKDPHDSDESTVSNPPKNGKKRKKGRKQRRLTKTTPSGLPRDTVEVKLRSDTEEYSCYSFTCKVSKPTLWHDSKFCALPGHNMHALSSRIRRLDSIGMSQGRRSNQPYAVIDPGAVEELIGGDGWYINYISTQTETLTGALEGMGTLTLPKVNAITAVKTSIGKIILLGVGNATYDARATQYESLLNSHHLRSNGVDVQDIARCHGGLQRLEIKVGQEINYIPLDFDGDIMKLQLRAPTEEEMKRMEVIWVTPAMSEPNLRSVRRSVNVRSSYKLLGTGNSTVHEEEVSTSTPVTAENNNATRKGVMDWKATLGYPNDKVLKRTLETTTQLCAEPVEMEQREIPRQHRKKRLLPLHPRRLSGRVDSDTFFASVKSIRGYKCVQFFVHIPSDFIFCRCMQRESHSHGAYQDFIREIGAPEIIATDNSQTQTGKKWEATSRSIVTKQRKFSPHNQNQNKAERRIQDAKHKSVHVLEKSGAPLSFWCYALIFVIDCLNYQAKESLGWTTSFERLNGDTPDISAFRFHFWESIQYYEPTSRFPEARWRTGRFLGIAWNSGDAFTFIVWTEPDGDWNTGRELIRNIVRSHPAPSPIVKQEEDTASFCFQKKVYSNKRRGPNRDRVYNLVPIADTNDSLVKESNLPEIESGSAQEDPIPTKSDSTNVFDSEENLGKSTELPIVTTINPKCTTKDADILSSAIEPTTPTNIEMVKEINDQYVKVNEGASIGGSDVTRIDSHDWRMGQLRLKVVWSSGDSTWESFRDMQDDHPLKTATYITNNHVTRKKRGGDRNLQWAKKVLRDMDRATRRLQRLYDFHLDSEENIKYSRRTKRKKKKGPSRPTMKYGVQVPRNVKEAYLLDEKNGDTYWQNAIKLEMDSLLEMNCFDFKSKDFLPDADYQRTTLHVIFDVKQDLRRKARLVAGGHLLAILDTPTYSSTVKSISVQILHVIAHKTKMSQLCGDIGNAYVNASTNEKVYARAGPEFGEHEGCIVIIIKALYGLCSSSERWHSHFSNTLRTFNFKPTRFDKDVWIRKHESRESYDYVCTHSDDFMITSHSPEIIMEQIQSVYKVKESSKGEPNYYLGHDYKKDKRGRWCIGCKRYLNEAIKRIEKIFGHLDKNCTPMTTGDHPEEDASPILNETEQQNYQMLIGILNWLTCLGRLDIAFAASSLSRFNACARKGHLDRVLRVFGYLKKNKNRRVVVDSSDPIHVGGEDALNQDFTQLLSDFYPDAKEEIDTNLPPPLIDEIEITAFIDSDHAHDKITRRSITGLMILLGRTPVFILSKRQGAIETSTYGAEFCAMRTAVEEVQSIRYMLRCLGVKVAVASLICGDNLGVIQNCTVSDSLLKKKHVAIAYHKSRESAAAGIVHPIKVASKNNFADILTKAMSGPAFWSILERVTRG